MRRVLTSVLFSFLVIAMAVGLARAGSEETPEPPRALHGPIVPKPEPLTPSPFTLEERYLDAVRRGDTSMVKLTLEKGADLHAKDGFKRSALLLAARDARNLDLVKLLHERGLPVDEADVRGKTPLACAAGNGDLEIVSYLLEQGAELDHVDRRGQTPMFHAALGGSRETVAKLLAAGAETNVRDQFKDTPLMGACAKGFDEIARLLVDKGADASLKDQEGRTARERAAPSAEFCRSLGTAQTAP